MDMKRFFLYVSIAIAALALAGCGGNVRRMAGGGKGGEKCDADPNGNLP